MNYLKQEKSMEMIKLLLEKKADPKTEKNSIKNVLFHSENTKETLKLFSDFSADLNVPDKSNLIPLQQFFKRNRFNPYSLDIARILLRNTFDVNLLYPNKLSLLDVCLKKKKIDFFCLMKIFLEKRVDLHYQNHFGSTVLHTACKNLYASSKTVHFLLENKCDMNLKDKFKKSPLFYLLNRKHVDIEKAYSFLCFSADPNSFFKHHYNFIRNNKVSGEKLTIYILIFLPEITRDVKK